MNEQLDTSDLDAVLDGIVARMYPTPAEIEEAGAFILRRILDRTARGRSVRGHFFRAYAESTAEDRARRGRNTTRPDLTDTGKMMASATYREDGGDVLLYFASRTEGRKAQWHHEGTSRMPRREWFAASAGDLRDAGKMVSERIAARLEGAS